MAQIILILHLLIALVIIGLILLQQGKGAEMGASFGAGASQTLFGSAGSSNALTTATAWLAALFFTTSFGLAILANQQSAAVDDFDLEIPVVEQEAPVPAADSELPVVKDEPPVLESRARDDLPLPE